MIYLVLILSFFNNCFGKLIPWKYSSFKLGTVKPEGWLLTQLEIQSNGLTGHLSEMWHGVQNSSWIQSNGTGDNQLEEFTPYWLNGIIPLHFLLPNNKLIANESWKYISYILSHQNKTNGWLGVDNISGGNQYWGRWNVLNAFRMYCDGNSSMCDILKQSMLSYILEQEYRMLNVAQYGYSWSGARWMSFVLSVQWLLDNGGDIINGYQQNLTNVCNLSYAQGFNWENYFEYDVPKIPIQPNTSSYYNHGVNIGQALKSSAVWYRFTQNNTLKNLSISRLNNIDKYHGIATGIFAADGHLAGRNPSRGTELCAVVEYMFSLQILFRMFGNISFLDRLEIISYNALPATFGSPSSGDMTAHQYLQQNNEINAMETNPHIWNTGPGPQATVYGLSPNYGCCTANFNQGWPKLAAGAIFYKLNDNYNDIAIGVYAPSSTFVHNTFINITTNYPFNQNIKISINNTINDNKFNVYLRVPCWSTKNAQIIKENNNINKTYNVSNYKCKMYTMLIQNKSDIILYINFKPKIRIYSGYNNSVSLLYGSLLFSYSINETWKIVNQYEYGINDYWCLPKNNTFWNYALIINDTNNLSKYVNIKQYQWINYNGRAPFNKTNIPIKLYVNASIVKYWGIDGNFSAAAAVPLSPACITNNSCINIGEIELIPHGATNLRIAEFPLAY